MIVTAATKYHCLAHIWSGETYVKDISSVFVSDKYLKEELMSETYLYLSEMDETKLLTLFNSGQIRYYIFGLIKNQIRSETSRFYRTHLRPQKIEDEFEDKHQTKYEYAYTEKDEQLEIISEAVDKLDFYRKELFQLYYNCNMSLMEISDYTASKNPLLRIPKTSIYHAVKSAKEDVIDYIKKNYPDLYTDDFYKRN